MKTIKMLNGETVELNAQRTWCVVMTDPIMSGWGMAEGKTAKRVYICKDRAEAATFFDRVIIKAHKYCVKYVNMRLGIPYYSPSRYVVTYDKPSPHLFR
jgi:hypothetical protein